MEEETADEGGGGDSNPSGPDSRRRITTKRDPREAGDEQATVTGQHVPRRDVREDDPTGPCGSCHYTRGTGRVP